MSDINILWVDDEIDLLKPHIIFLEQKGYRLEPCNNGIDALELCKQQVFDMVFLDENMPGISGLEVLVSIKSKQPNLPVVMITKSEEEHIMEEAIGSKIADYLIKPVHPKQLLSCLKRNLDHSRLVSEKTMADYRQAFGKIALDLGRANTHQEWIDLYKALVFWEIELENINDTGMLEILESQKQEANTLFFKYIKKHYRSWMQGEEAPLLSNTLLKKVVLPEVQKGKEAGTLLLVIDNLRYDQFMVLEQVLNTFYKKVQEMAYYSILPTTTQYARNALFSGLMPLEIEQLHPEYWKNDTEEGGKNLHEEYLLKEQLNRHGYDLNTAYHKITNIKKGRWLSDHFNSIAKNDLTVVVYNFVDMLSHSKTDMEVIKELAGDDKAYRSLTKSWFLNSPLLSMIQQAQDLKLKLIVTTDHGTINTDSPSKVVGDRNISTNLRYKTGKSLSYEPKDVYAVTEPAAIKLPAIHMSSSYIFAKERLFFAYPNKYNHYVKYFKNTYQHGGISMEEMIIPCAIFAPR